MVQQTKYNTQNGDRAKTKKNNTKPVLLLNFIDELLSDGEKSTILYRLNRHSQLL